MKTGTGSSHVLFLFSAARMMHLADRQSRGASILRGQYCPVIMAGAGDGGYCWWSFRRVPADPYRAFFPDDRGSVVHLLAVLTSLLSQCWPLRRSLPLVRPLLTDHAFCSGAFSLVGSDPRRGASFRAAQAGAVAASVPGGRPVGHRGSPIRQVGRDETIRRVRQKMTGEWMHGRFAPGPRARTGGVPHKSMCVFHGFFPQTSHQCCEKGRSSGAVCATRNGKRSRQGWNARLLYASFPALQACGKFL